MPPLVAIDPNIRRKRPGPKSKPLCERHITYFPIKRIQRNYSNNKKTQVLKFLLAHFIPFDSKSEALPGGRQRTNAPICDKPGYQLLTFKEASVYFKIPEKTINNWWKSCDTLNDRNTKFNPQWPELKSELLEAFAVRRDLRKPVSWR